MSKPLDLSHYITDSAIPVVDDAAIEPFVVEHANTQPVTIWGCWADTPPVTMVVPPIKLFDLILRAATAFNEAMQPLRPVFARFGDAVYAMIENAYIEAHPGKRLPKATKARWQKKRRKIVTAWFEQIEKGV